MIVVGTHRASGGNGAGSLARSVALLLLILAIALRPVEAQLVPNDHWKTIETRHFRVHFTPPLEEMARLSASNAERAYELLARELVPPHGKVDLVIADNVDYTNGYATPFPTNRIVIYAHPPVDDLSLRNYEDWSSLVIQHELTHIFHLDRAKGIWRLGRAIFGRHPALFPNVYMPAWVTEGLAVYYESRLTGTGRLEGSEHYMIAHAAAEAGAFPRLGEISLVTSRFPGGETAYAYGAFIFDYLSRTHGAQTIPKFIEQSSGAIFPLTLNGKSKRAFGISFERAWKQWTDSVLRSAPAKAQPLAGWRELTPEGWIVSSPRWLAPDTLIYSAYTGRDVPSAAAVSISGAANNLGRRNGTGANARLPNGDLVFSQPDYIDAYRLRNDLFVQHGNTQTRLTRGARLYMPDVRRDGSIVAVQNVAASTRLARVATDGRQVTPITQGSLDEQWTEPRWSPDGTRIAAVRILRGGASEIVVLDTLGAVIASFRFEHATPASPSWSTDGNTLYFSSDHSGTRQLYAVSVAQSGNVRPRRLSNTSTGLFAPEESPDATTLAALVYHVDGYHLGIAPLPPPEEALPDTAILGERSACANCRIPEAAGYSGLTPFAGAEAPYSPWRSLLPTYWEPLAEVTPDNGTLIGAATSGADIVGRHVYFARGTFNTKHHETEALGVYRYAGLGQPYVDLSAEQAWDHGGIFNSARKVVGDLGQLSRIYAASVTFIRPRARTYASWSAGGEVETRSYVSDPDTLIRRLPAFFSRSARYPSVFASAAWSNTRHPGLAISREDGVSLSGTMQQRWRNDTGENGSGSPTRSVVGVGAVYRSLDLPGFAHHVFAVRGAAGFADERAISAFSAGGLSGTSVDVIGGYSVGDVRRTFGVRGFPPSAERGLRALAGSMEYRAPLAAPSRHVRFIPVLFDRFSATAFADAGRAYCPSGAINDFSICNTTDVSNPWLASVGGELNLDAALYYDVPARIRLGVAAPVANRDFADAKAVSVYLTFGSSF